MLETEPSKYSLDSLQKTALTIMTALVITTFVATNFQALLWQSSQWLVSTVLPATVVELTNEQRTDVSQAPLRRNATLDAAARMKAKHMAENEYFSHYSPDGVSPWYWFDQSGYVYASAGENLAIHFTDSTEVVDAWMNSPTHKENIVSSKYSEIGVGTAKGTYEGYDTVYVVQLFGSPGVPVASAVETPEPVVVPETTITDVVPAVEVEPEPVFAQAPIVESEVAAVPELAERPVAETELEPLETAPATESSVSEEIVLEEPAVAESQSVAVPVAPALTSEPLETPIVSQTAEEPAVSAQDIVFLESPIISTSSGLAVANFTQPADPHAGATLASIATKPNTLLEYIYITLALVVLLLLSTSIVVEARRLHYIQVAYSFALIFGMGGLWFINSLLTSGAVII